MFSLSREKEYRIISSLHRVHIPDSEQPHGCLDITKDEDRLLNSNSNLRWGVRELGIWGGDGAISLARYGVMCGIDARYERQELIYTLDAVWGPDRVCCMPSHRRMVLEAQPMP